MLQLKYIGPMVHWVGKTVIGYWQNGELLVQWDDIHHPQSHGWWMVDPKDFESRERIVINKARIKQRLRALKYYLHPWKGKHIRQHYSRGILLDGAKHIFNHVKFDEVVRCGPINLWSVTLITGERYWYSSKRFWRRKRGS